MVALGCLHAHHSNIAYIDQILVPYEIATIHFVDPGLMRRITHDPGFAGEHALRRVRHQLEWMAACDVDAILLTCTNYIAELGHQSIDLGLPVIKIDEPFFAYLCQQPSPQTLLFTNPATVDGTTRRMHDYANQHACSLDVDVQLIEGSFEIFMAGKKAEYDRAVAQGIRQIVSSVGSGNGGSVAVGQLSIADAALRVSRELDVPIGNPLEPLRDHLVELLDLEINDSQSD
ncbi:MAG: hypothetical protein ACRDJW_06450 [Thermomicrobiales bacterium]